MPLVEAGGQIWVAYIFPNHHDDLCSRISTFVWIKIGDTAFLVFLEESLVNAFSNPVEQFNSSLLSTKASTARCWLEGMLGKSS